MSRELVYKVEIIDKDGRMLQQRDIDWFKPWPDADHLPRDKKPKARPGTIVHGVLLMENGVIGVLIEVQRIPLSYQSL